MVPIVTGVINFLSSKLGIMCWDGEVPRYDTNGKPINSNATSIVPPNTVPDWPFLKVYMQEDGFSRDWTFEDPYTDTGNLLIQVWGTTRTQTETIMDSVEGVMASVTNWTQISLDGGTQNPNYGIQFLLDSWYLGQQEGERTADSELIYRGDMNFYTQLHGAISTS